MLILKGQFEETLSDKSLWETSHWKEFGQVITHELSLAENCVNRVQKTKLLDTLHKNLSSLTSQKASLDFSGCPHRVPGPCTARFQIVHFYREVFIQLLAHSVNEKIWCCSRKLRVVSFCDPRFLANRGLICLRDDTCGRNCSLMAFFRVVVPETGKTFK